ncbi:site-specific recombinase XerD [Sinorhizobium fredii]|uniref:tyrosine-type recombinase/integrase n=1 Tax=Rhizobium fredii TaxID=380 RepID=UPI00351186BC
MSVYKASGSPYYRYDFQIDGNRFHGSTKTRSKRDAEAVERRLKENAKRELKAVGSTGNAPLTIDIAIGQYWTEKGQFRSGTGYFATLEALVTYFGKDKRMDDIDDRAIVDLVEHKRQQLPWGKTKLKNGKLKTLSNATINRQTLEPLKTVFRRAKLWGYHFPKEPRWREHWLKEPQERVRELHRHEQEALDVSIRGDYQPWFSFVQLSGRRFNETLIRWSNVNWDAGEIVTMGKGDRRVWTPITPSIRKILESCRGHHPEFVFTYIAQRTRDGRLKGQRYPLTYGGTGALWKRAIKKSGVQDFRLHDNRHDTATKLLRQTNNLKLVQRVLNHAHLSTTAKYAHVMDDEVARALEINAQSRNKSRTRARDWCERA